MDKPSVLFLCVHNAARSQLAEALLRHRAGDRFEARSAGLEPTEVAPEVPIVLEEVGVDASGLRAKSLEEFLAKQHVHYLITVCQTAEDDCPRMWPGLIEHIFWPTDDPDIEGDAEERMRAFRAARDVLDARILEWVDTV